MVKGYINFFQWQEDKMKPREKARLAKKKKQREARLRASVLWLKKMEKIPMGIESDHLSDMGYEHKPVFRYKAKRKAVR